MPEPIERFQFTADRGDARLRLDQVLVRRAHEAVRLSRHVAQQWIESGAVTVGGRLVRRSAAGVAEGMEIVVTLPDTARLRSKPEAEHGDLDLLHEDDALIAVNKPAGLVVHPTYKASEGTLLNRLLWLVRDRPLLRPSILTRLDKDTSGSCSWPCGRRSMRRCSEPPQQAA
jgi:23S rRNA pseudouridine1911/1915/1917 synthase